LDITAFKEGSGVIVSDVNLTFSTSETLKVSNTYTLGADAAYVKTQTNVTNLGASAVSNVRLWVGTRDDYVGTRDSQFKFKGNLGSSGFEQITAQTQQAKALKITEFNDGQGAAILFYSTSSGADTSLSTCCDFSNATNTDPRTSLIFRGQSGGNPSAEDGSYALFIRLANLAAGATDGMTWYYAAAPVAELSTVVSDVSQSAGVTPPPAAPTPTVPISAAIQTAQVLPQIETTGQTRSNPTTGSTTPIGAVATLQPDALPSVGRLSGSLNIIPIAQPTTTSLASSAPSAPAASSGGSGSQGSGGASSSEGGDQQASGETGDAALVFGEGSEDVTGFMKVFVVGGGVKLPDSAKDEE
jgi:hypothetical protein